MLQNRLETDIYSIACNVLALKLVIWLLLLKVLGIVAPESNVGNLHDLYMLLFWGLHHSDSNFPSGNRVIFVFVFLFDMVWRSPRQIPDFCHLSGIPVVFYKMLAKYHRKFQTDDKNLEFAEGTLLIKTVHDLSLRCLIHRLVLSLVNLLNISRDVLQKADNSWLNEKLTGPAI